MNIDMAVSLLGGVMNVAASLVKIGGNFITASADKRAELVAEAEADFQKFLTLMQGFDEAIKKINEEIDEELKKS